MVAAASHPRPFEPFARHDAAGAYLGVQRLGEDERHVRFVEEATERWSTDSREVVRIDQRLRELDP